MQESVASWYIKQPNSDNESDDGAKKKRKGGGGKRKANKETGITVVPDDEVDEGSEQEEKKRKRKVSGFQFNLNYLFACDDSVEKGIDFRISFRPLNT